MRRHRQKTARCELDRLLALDADVGCSANHHDLLAPLPLGSMSEHPAGLVVSGPKCSGRPRLGMGSGPIQHNIGRPPADQPKGFSSSGSFSTEFPFWLRKRQELYTYLGCSAVVETISIRSAPNGRRSAPAQP